MIFGTSGILSLQQGINIMLFGKGHHIENISISSTILIISGIFEWNALRVALKLFRQTIEARGEKVSFSTLAKEFQDSKDTSILTVILEDSAAIIGLIIAGIGISLSETTGNMIFDSIGSVGMGIISMVFAFFLAKENKALLIGEAISKKDYRRIVEIVHRIPEVNRLISLRTIHFAEEDVLVAMDVSPKDGLTTDEIESVINHIKQRVKQVIPYIHPSKIYVEVEQDSCNIN